MRIWRTEHTESEGLPEIVLRAISQQQAFSLAPDGSQGEGVAPRIVPATHAETGLALLMVPAAASGQVARNRVRLAFGAHVLRHADRLDFDGRTLWVAADHEIARVPYEPATHGENVYCLITKARLKEDEPIVVCPGPAGGQCGALYREAAWEMVRQTNDHFRCPRCSFDPAADEWQPTLPHRSNLEQLFELARQWRIGDPA